MYTCPYCQKALKDLNTENESMSCPHCGQEFSLIDEPEESPDLKSQEREEEISSSASSDFSSEIENFGNSPQSHTLEGPLTFSLTLKNIHSQNLKKEVFDLLKEKKLFLEVTSLQKKLKDGKLIIDNLSATKASYIIKNLQHLPIQLQWSQDSYQKS